MGNSARKMPAGSATLTSATTSTALAANALYYNAENKIFECSADDRGRVCATFVVSLQPKREDELPGLRIACDGLTFFFAGRYRAPHDSLVFDLTGPVGYGFKASLSVDNDDGTYCWKIKRRGTLAGRNRVIDGSSLVIPVPVIAGSRLLRSENCVVKHWSFYGPSVPAYFAEICLKVALFRSSAASGTTDEPTFSPISGLAFSASSSLAEDAISDQLSRLSKDESESAKEECQKDCNTCHMLALRAMGKPMIASSLSESVNVTSTIDDDMSEEDKSGPTVVSPHWMHGKPMNFAVAQGSSSSTPAEVRDRVPTCTNVFNCFKVRDSFGPILAHRGDAKVPPFPLPSPSTSAISSELTPKVTSSDEALSFKETKVKGGKSSANEESASTCKTTAEVSLLQTRATAKVRVVRGRSSADATREGHVSSVAQPDCAKLTPLERARILLGLAKR